MAARWLYTIHSHCVYTIFIVVVRLHATIYCAAVQMSLYVSNVGESRNSIIIAHANTTRSEFGWYYVSSDINASVKVNTFQIKKK